jgi:hypothetical protein
MGVENKEVAFMFTAQKTIEIVKSIFPVLFPVQKLDEWDRKKAAVLVWPEIEGELSCLYQTWNDGDRWHVQLEDRRRGRKRHWIGETLIRKEGRPMVLSRRKGKEVMLETSPVTTVIFLEE